MKLNNKIIIGTIIIILLAMQFTLCAKASETEPYETVYRNLDQDIKDHITESCIDKDIDEGMLLAMIWFESGFNSDAINYNEWNDTYDRGLVQINEVVLKDTRLCLNVSEQDLFDPYINIDVATELLYFHKTNLETDNYNALLAYQIGEGGYARAVGKYENYPHTYTRVVEYADKFNKLLDIIEIESVCKEVKNEYNTEW